MQQEIQSVAEKQRVRERMIKRNLAQVEPETSARDKGDDNPIGLMGTGGVVPGGST